MSNRIICLLISFLLTSCISIQVKSDNSPTIITEDENVLHDNSNENNVVDTISPEPSSWIVPSSSKKSLRKLNWDLIHQKIWLTFNFERSEVHGRTELHFENLKPNNRELIIDSKTTHIQSVVNVETRIAVPFLRDSSTVTITLPEEYDIDDSLIIAIEFVSTPGNRGLYFVNPNGDHPTKPTQIWTLGQPEDNSFWLPTVDHPSERTTTEIWLSVPDEFTTISNGVLIRSAFETESDLRTDYWVMDKPHAPYLIAFAVGEYVSNERLNDGVVIKYYAEPDYEDHLDVIYAETIDMMQLFNRKLNYAYPWGVYSQVPVRDYIANGMENTTLSIYKEQIQVTERQSKDVHFRDLLVHELIHHWFGNLVTSKDWANLPLNEGFATYFETIYRDYRDGETDAAWKTILDRNDYFTESKRFRRPIIFDKYTVPEDMYDRHTYEKAALVLRMLHQDVGDEIWWSTLNTYITENDYDSVDWIDLKNAFNKTTGEDYTNFFEQWFLKNGHPEFHITYNYDGENPTVRIRQMQDFSKSDVFQTKMIISYSDIVHNEYMTEVDITSEDTLFTIPVAADSTSYVVVDPQRVILAEYSENIDLNEIISRLAHPSVILRYEAVELIRQYLPDNEFLIDVLINAFQIEQYSYQRLHILETLSDYLDEHQIEFIESITFDNEELYSIRILSADLSAKIRGVVGNKYLELLLDDPSYYVEQHVNGIISRN